MNIVGELKYYLGEDYAVLRFSETNTSFSIDTVIVPAAYRTKGIGTFLIKHILVMADCLSKDVLVSARPIGATSQEKLERLIKYYERLGFEMYDRGMTIAYMKRKVRR